MLLAILAAVLGATVQSALGFGFALVAAPAMFAALEPIEALTTILILSSCVHLLTLLGERRRRDIRTAEVRLLLIASIPGLFLGAAVFSELSKPALQIGVGLSVLAAVVLDSRRTGRAESPSALPSGGPRTGVTLPVGLLSGFLTTTTTTNGPPMVLLFRARGVRPAELRDSIALVLLCQAVLGIAIPPLFDRGGFGIDPEVLLPAVVAVAIGQLIGRRIFRRLPAERFHRAGLAVVLAAGVASLVAGLSGA